MTYTSFKLISVAFYCIYWACHSTAASLIKAADASVCQELIMVGNVSASEIQDNIATCLLMTINWWSNYFQWKASKLKWKKYLLRISNGLYRLY